jgi:hypothetical protein
LSALARGPQSDGNPNFMDPEGCAELCDRFGLTLIAAAPDRKLDLREPNGRLPDCEMTKRVGAYCRTIEFVAERPVIDKPRRLLGKTTKNVRRVVRRLIRR